MLQSPARISQAVVAVAKHGGLDFTCGKLDPLC